MNELLGGGSAKSDSSAGESLSRPQRDGGVSQEGIRIP